MAQTKSQAASESAKEPAETAGEQHKCVFCAQLFPSKPDLQTHFRLHANGVIDIKGQPKGQGRAAQRPSRTTTFHTTAKTTTATTTTTTSSTTTTAATTTTTTTATTTTATTTSTTTSTMTAAATTTSTGKNTAACDVCGESFHTVSLAISHKFRKHPDSIAKHYCPHCGMMFPIKLSRDKHLLTHSGPPPKQLFPCVPCGVTFYNQRAKKFHMDSAHKGATRMVNPIRTPAPSMKIVVNNAGEPLSVYYCHLCGCEYQVKYNLQKHLASKHTQAERDALPKELVQCNLCSAVFYSKRAYEAHSHHHRDGDLFATNEQMRQQVVQRIDQDFDHRRVPTPVERYLSASAVTSNRSATWKNIQAARRAQATFTSSLQSISSSSSGSTSLQFIDSSTSLSSPSSVYSVSSSSSSLQPLTSSSSQSHKEEREDMEREGREEQEDKEGDESQNSSSSAKQDQIENEEDDKNLNFLTHSKGREIHIPLPALRGGDQEEEEEGGREGGRGGTQGDFLPWAMDDGRRKRRRRMMDESEEEDEGEVMRSLGNVNPDTILSRGVMREEGDEEEEVEDCGRTAMEEEGERNEEEGRTDVVEEEAEKKRREDAGKKKGKKKRKEDDEDKEEMTKKRKKKIEAEEEIQDKEEALKRRRRKKRKEEEDMEEEEGIIKGTVS